jgi:hypothetical protein
VLRYDFGALFYASATMGLHVDVDGSAALLDHNDTRAFPGANGCYWQPKTYTFIADSTTTTLRFTDISTATNAVDCLLANVAVEEVLCEPIRRDRTTSCNHSVVFYRIGIGQL